MAYGEVGQAEFIRDNTGAITGIRMQGRTWSPGSVATGGVTEAANLAAFPATGDTSFLYAAMDTRKVYLWTGSAYVEASGLPGNTDVVPEGSTNLYSTAARILGQVLTAIDVTTRGAVDATKTVLQAIGLLEASKQDKLKNQTLVTNTTYTVADTDAGKELVISNAAGCLITIPVGLSAKFRCDWLTTSAAAGAVTFQGDGTSSLLSTNNVFTATGPKCAGQISFTGTTNQYMLSGQLGTIGSTDISDWVAATYARVLAILTAGANVTLTGNGTTISVASTGGSGGSAPPWELGNFECSVAYPGNATFSTTGANGFASTGNLSAQTGTWNGTNYAQRIRNTSTAAGVNTSCLLSNSQPVGLVPGTSTSDAAVRLSGLFMSGDSNAGCRIGAGFLAVQTPTATVEPSTLLNMAMFGADSGDTNLSFMSNDGSGTATKTDLGANFPKDGSGPYAWWIKMVGGGSGTRGLSWFIKNTATGNTQSGSTTTAADLPTAAGEVHPFTYRNSAAYSSTTILLDVAGIWGGVKSGVA